MGAAARPVRTKRPSRRAAEPAAGAQIPPTRAASMKRPGGSAHQAEAPAVVGMAEAAARSASRIGGAKRRRRTAQIPSPPSPRVRARARAKKETSGSHPLRLDPCSNRGGKRAGSKLQELPGPKRARSSSSSSTDLPCPPDNDNRYVPSEAFPPLYRRRDWANLADGPAGLIADRLLAYDVADYVRYRAVCRPWRRSSTEPRSHSGLDRRFHPWRWTMLREELAAAPDRHSFLNTSTGQCVQVDIPELSDNLLLAITPEGLLFLVHKTQRAPVRLLNPFTRQLTELPPLTTLIPPKDHHQLIECNPLFDEDFIAWGSGIASDNSTFVVCFKKLHMLGMAKPGDDHWTMLKYDGDCMTTAPLMFAGRFYCVNLSGVMVLEAGADEPPQLEVAAELNMRVSPIADSLHLVNNCGELMLVHRRGGFTSGNNPGWCYDTYRVYLDTGTLLPVKSLGGPGRALFMGMHCSLSVSLEVFPSGSISADTIYLSFDVAERELLNVGAYHLADGTIEPPCRLVARPHTLVDCLSLTNTVEE